MCRVECTRIVCFQWVRQGRCRAGVSSRISGNCRLGGQKVEARGQRPAGRGHAHESAPFRGARKPRPTLIQIFADVNGTAVIGPGSPAKSRCRRGIGKVQRRQSGPARPAGRPSFGGQAGMGGPGGRAAAGGALRTTAQTRGRHGRAGDPLECGVGASISPVRGEASERRTKKRAKKAAGRSAGWVRASRGEEGDASSGFRGAGALSRQDRTGTSFMPAQKAGTS